MSAAPLYHLESQELLLNGCRESAPEDPASTRRMESWRGAAGGVQPEGQALGSEAPPAAWLVTDAPWISVRPGPNGPNGKVSSSVNWGGVDWEVLGQQGSQ